MWASSVQSFPEFASAGTDAFCLDLQTSEWTGAYGLCLHCGTFCSFKGIESGQGTQAHATQQLESNSVRLHWQFQRLYTPTRCHWMPSLLRVMLYLSTFPSVVLAPVRSDMTPFEHYYLYRCLLSYPESSCTAVDSRFSPSGDVILPTTAQSSRDTRAHAPEMRLTDLFVPGTISED
ncbi:hypothetical protein VUR80DRAFT_3036 [Thermomyces stellatus]